MKKRKLPEGRACKGQTSHLPQLRVGEAASNVLRQLTVSLRPESDSEIVFSPTAAVNSDDSFTIRKVGPGDYTLEMPSSISALLASGWLAYDVRVFKEQGR